MPVRGAGRGGVVAQATPRSRPPFFFLWRRAEIERALPSRRVNDAAHLIEDLAAALAAERGLGPAVSAEASRRLDELRRGRADESPSSLIGDAYQALLSRGARRRGGVHYTAPALTARVVEQAIEALDPSVGAAPRVLDPAMGAGAFLCAALDALLARGGRDTPAERRRLALACAHGMDKDPMAVLAARRALWLWVGDATLPRDAFDAQLICCDALLDKTPLHRAEGYPLVLGNPPFLGGKRIRTELGDAYADALKARHAGANKNTDLAAHFLRRGWSLLAQGGVLGFVTTNSIAQGDTRAGGIGWIVKDGGTLVGAARRVKWPGVAGVVTSLVWIKRGPHEGACTLDGERVAHIDVFLSGQGRAADPHRLEESRGRAFIGCFLRGRGFVFDPTDPADRARCAELEAVLDAEPSSRALVRPFMGGEEVLVDPQHRPHRRVIHFESRSLEEAQRHPRLLALVEREVRGFRETRGTTPADRAHAAAWWRFANPRPELAAASAGLPFVVVLPRVSGHLVAVRVPAGTVFSDQLVVVASASHAVLALYASRVHAAWAHQLCSTLGDGLRYTPSDVFETLPLPFATFAELSHDPALCEAGRRFEAARATVLVADGRGLSHWLGRLARGDRSPSAMALREAWRALDRAVLEAYGLSGLTDVALRDSDAPEAGSSRTRWGFPAEVERAIVAHLLAENERRALAPAARRSTHRR